MTAQPETQNCWNWSVEASAKILNLGHSFAAWIKRHRSFRRTGITSTC